jgi:hypothetical protein
MMSNGSERDEAAASLTHCELSRVVRECGVMKVGRREGLRLLEVEENRLTIVLAGGDRLLRG